MGLDFLRRTAIVALPASLAMLGPAAMPHADAAQTGSVRLAVGARILPLVRMRIARQPDTIEITQGDVSRGFAEVVAASTMEVATNAPWEVSFRLRGGPIRAARVSGLPAEVVVPPGGGPRATLAFLPTSTNFQLSFRFELVPGMRAGTYPWPLVVSVQGL